MPSLARITVVYKPVQLWQDVKLLWHFQRLLGSCLSSGCLGITIMMFTLHIPVCSYLYNGQSLFGFSVLCVYSLLISTCIQYISTRMAERRKTHLWWLFSEKKTQTNVLMFWNGVFRLMVRRTCMSGCAICLMRGNPPSVTCPNCAFGVAACTCAGTQPKSPRGFFTLSKLRPQLSNQPGQPQTPDLGGAGPISLQCKGQGVR